MGEYAHPEMLVSTQWVDDHRNDPGVTIVEVDVDTEAYVEGHIPGSIGWSWETELCDRLRRDIIPKKQFEILMGNAGIDNSTLVILYGDNNNWFAAWAYWQLKIYGHENMKLMNGGRRKWLAEGRELTREIPSVTPVSYQAKDSDFSIRSFLADVQKASESGTFDLVDVRSPQEFSGEILAPPGLPETCQRGGHVPGAKNITWSKVCNADGTFKSFDELKALYDEAGIKGDKPVIAYCRIGERSSHTWFVLKYLLGMQDVRNYDGSWTEWGNLVGVPIAKD